MAHSYLPAIAGQIITLEQVNELIAQYNERRSLLSLSTLTPLASLERAFYLTDAICQMQIGIEAILYNDFWAVAHNANGSARSPGYYHGASAIDTYTMATLWAAVTGSSSGWTRWTDTGIQRGRIQAGDRICTQNLNEIMGCLDRMVWFCRGTADYEVTAKMRYIGTDWHNSYAAAIAAAQAEWDAEPTADMPFTYPATHAYSYYQRSTSPVQYKVDLWQRQSSCVEWHVWDTSIACAVDIYAYLEPYDGGTFDTHGDFADASPNTMYLAHTGAASTDAVRTTGYFGQTDDGDYPNTNAENSPGYRGYFCEDFWGVERWNVSGGFTYY